MRPRGLSRGFELPARAASRGPFLLSAFAKPPSIVMEGDALSKKTYPRFHDLTHTALTNPLLMDASATNVWREVGRKSGDRFSGSPTDLPASVGSGSLRVAAGKAQSGQMAGRGARRSTSYS